MADCAFTDWEEAGTVIVQPPTPVKDLVEMMSEQRKEAWDQSVCNPVIYPIDRKRLDDLGL